MRRRKGKTGVPTSVIIRVPHFVMQDRARRRRKRAAAAAAENARARAQFVTSTEGSQLRKGDQIRSVSSAKAPKRVKRSPSP